MDWAALPPELLNIILEKLAEATDHVRFCCTCLSWRSVARSHSMPPSFPWLFLPHKRSTANLQFYSFSENRIYKKAFPEIQGSRQIIGSASGFLLVVGEDQSSKVLIINPFTNARTHLPSIPPAATVLTWDYSGCIVVAYFGHLDEVAYCRPGDHHWSTIIDVPRDIIVPVYTIIYKSGSFYLQPNWGLPCLNVLDAETLKLTRTIICPEYNCTYLRFVPTTDDTLLCLNFNIIDNINRIYCTVCKLNHQNFSWSKTTDIGDHALFDDDRFAFIFEADRHAELWKTVHFPALSRKYTKFGSYKMNTSDFGNLLSEPILDPDSYSSCPFWILPSFGTM